MLPRGRVHPVIWPCRVGVVLIALALLKVRIATFAAPRSSGRGFRRSLLHVPAAVASISAVPVLATPAWTAFECSGYSLSNLQAIGAGAHGAVYADVSASLVAKVSYPNTADVIKDECATLKRLEAAKVPYAERCLGVCTMDGHAVAVFSPYFVGGRQVSSTVISALSTDALGLFINASTTFLLRCFAANVAISDLQVLVRSDGAILVIDFTGAGPIDDAVGFERASQCLGEWTTVLPEKIHIAVVESFARTLELLPPGALSANAAMAIAQMTLAGAPEALLQRAANAAYRAAR